ncbi:MAG: CBS domain-containing protein [Desulfobacterales bacterium]
MSDPIAQRGNGGGLTLIATHINADFDALASLLAARKIYPEGKVVFPGSQEKNLRTFFVSSLLYLFHIVELSELDLDRVRRLVLVDTRQPGRIGKLAALLSRPDLEIHVYDHHPDSEGDIRGAVEVCEPVGATVTLLVEILRERGVRLTAEEATILCLGLYEDTGSFTYPSTTPRDLAAASWLLSCGAALNVVSDLIARELNPEQVALLNDMIQSAHRLHINGIEVVVTGIQRETYIPDFAFLVQKMARMENLEVFFALALMESKIHIVGRSRREDVDVGAILGTLGGGGHPYAAAATLKGMTLQQAEALLLERLRQTLQNRRLAASLMSSPPISVDAAVSCEAANGVLTRYNVNALLVTETPPGGQPALRGYITRQVVEKALFHGLGRVPVSEYMTSEVAVVGPEADLQEIQKKIIEHKQRILPVVDGGGKILGVITRTDLLNVLVGRERMEGGTGRDPLREGALPRTRNLAPLLAERLSPRLLSVLREIGAVAAELGLSAYVVGGFVRDLLLQRQDEDIDIVIEGDGIAFARRFARQAGARLHTHERFGTAVIAFPDGLKIDVASARLEYYRFPAALPTVEMSSIKLDLYRRDFTINTLALQLNPGRFGTLIDFFNAQKDIKEKTIRVLHNLSLVEDPTRAFRAIRFEQRFGFTIGRLTAGLIQNAVKMDFFRNLSGRRLFQELKLLLEEENPVAAVQRLGDFQLLPVLHPQIAFDRGLGQLLQSVRQVVSWYDLLFLGDFYMKWAVYFLALIDRLDAAQAAALCRRFELPPRLERLFTEGRTACRRCLQELARRLPLENSAVYRLLRGFQTELVLFMMAAAGAERVKKAISLYFTQLRRVTTSVNGEDLKRLGVPPGPLYRRVLDQVLDARLNGRVETREEELAFVRGLLRPHAPDHEPGP